jgi:signal transduction histidine kinase
VQNLIENGLVHGPAGGRVTIDVRRRGDLAVLTVSDDGPGPSPEQHARMFERFWRGPDSSERPGSGLGLSIVSAIVRRHGGSITVDGSAFTVELRVCR